MDVRIDEALSMIRLGGPSLKSILLLSEQLCSEGAYASAHALAQAALEVVEPTPELVEASASSLFLDAYVDFQKRSAEALKIIGDHFCVSVAELPLRLHRLRVLISTAAATRSSEVSAMQLAAADTLALCTRESGERAFLRAVDFLWITDVCIVEVGPARESEPLRLQIHAGFADGRQIATSIIRSYLIPKEKRPSDESYPDELALAVGAAMIGDWQRGRQTLSELHPESVQVDRINSSLKQMLFCLQAHGIRLRDRVEEEACQTRDEVVAVLEAVVGIVKVGDWEAYTNRVWASANLKRVGLALSGGGLRAAFFQLGTFAYLAERDILRHVDVLSTVSGGSIVGTLYYLELRKLISSRSDSEIDKSDYMALIERVISQFMKVGQIDLRSRAFGDFGHLLSGIFKARFHRTARMANLYTRAIYGGFFSEGQQKSTLYNAAISVEKRRISDSESENIDRTARIPELILNATSLTNGCKFAFSPSWIGERFGAKNSDVELLNDIPIGFAVAASSCVPTLFDPLNGRGLFSEKSQERMFNGIEVATSFDEEVKSILDRFTKDDDLERQANMIRLARAKASRYADVAYPMLAFYQAELVDGGLYDNLGIDSLLESKCSLMICSDGASPFTSKSSIEGIKAASRTSEILMNRIRDFVVARFLTTSGGAHVGAFIVSLGRLRTGEGETFDEGLAKKLQAVRTDLDFFSETEMLTLAAAGYAATMDALQDFRLPAFDVRQQIPAGDAVDDGPRRQPPWQFAPLMSYLATTRDESYACRRLHRHIDAARHRFNRIMTLSTWHKLFFISLPLVFVGGCGALVHYAKFVSLGDKLDHTSPLPGEDLDAYYLLLLIGLLYVAAFFLREIFAFLHPRRMTKRIFYSIVALITVPTRMLWLSVVDPLLSRSGGLAQVLDNRRRSNCESKLASATVALWMICLSVVTAYGLERFKQDSYGRQPLAFATWSPGDCEKRIRSIMLRHEITGGSEELTEQYCAQKWDGAVLTEMVSEFKQRHPLTWSLWSNRELFNNGARDVFNQDEGAFVSFVEARLILLFLYLPDENLVIDEDGKGLGDLENGAALRFLSEWKDRQAIDTGSYGLVHSLCFDGLGRVELIFPIQHTLSIGRLGELLKGSDAGSLNTASDLELEQRLETSLKSVVGAIGIPPHLAPLSMCRSKEMPLQVVAISEAKQVRCLVGVLDLGDQVSLCQRDERLFVLETSKPNRLQSSQKATLRFTDAQLLRIAEALVQKTKVETVQKGNVALQ